jgi:hypothetical protein
MLLHLYWCVDKPDVFETNMSPPQLSNKRQVGQKHPAMRTCTNHLCMLVKLQPPAPQLLLPADRPMYKPVTAAGRQAHQVSAVAQIPAAELWQTCLLQLLTLLQMQTHILQSVKRPHA